MEEEEAFLSTCVFVSCSERSKKKEEAFVANDAHTKILVKEMNVQRQQRKEEEEEATHNIIDGKENYT
jgi:hypothetical protein